MSGCVRPGCDGTYGPHGYCGRCGRKAPKSELAAEQPRSEPTSGRVRSRRSGRGTAPTVSDRVIGTTRPKAGIVVDLPEVAPRNPATLSWVDWEVSESKRFCHNAKCGEPVGRGRDGEPGLTSGFCRKCGWKFVAGPTLSKGELVDKRYEIFHCLARGGQGWIYLARDRNLGDEVAEHWVVLKGLIDTDDPDAAEQAVLERRYLTEVSHPNIVKINDFVRHPDPLTGRESGYIVMEYVAGRSLLELYREHRDEYGLRAPLPLTHVLAYGTDVLTAMDYLHRRGLLYSDFKPENTLISGTDVKIIDLGAVLRAGEPVRAIYRTPGYAPPEIEPSVAADIYTVGRTLAVLSLEFVGFSKEFQHRLPAPADVPLLAEQESFHRLLRRATHPDPAHRFASAEEMRGQLEGVLLEVQSDADGQPRPAISTRFGVERRTFGTDAGAVSTEDIAAVSVDWTSTVQALPAPLVDPADPSAGYLAAIAATDPDDVIDALRAIPAQTREVVLQLVGAQIAAGHLTEAEADLDGYASSSPNDWRVSWHRGMIALAGARPHEARLAFDAVYDALPGELAPKLALAAASEWDGDDGRAEELYDRVWRTNNSYVSAAFGLARVLGRQGDPDSAVDALDGVPESSSQHVLAQVAAIRTRLAAEYAKPNLLEASARLQRLKMGIERQARLSIELLTAALDWVKGDKTGDRSGVVLGHPLEEKRLRLGLEQAYRDLAKVSADTDRRIALVKQANRIRPRTWF